MSWLMDLHSIAMWPLGLLICRLCTDTNKKGMRQVSADGFQARATEHTSRSWLQIEVADNIAQGAATTVLRAIPELQLLLKDIGSSNRDGCATQIMQEDRQSLL